MSNASRTSGIQDVLANTSHRQALAADPAASVWVSANAGTGKTHVLTCRVLRLMLSGTAPERILCLTYTKAAAAEMSKRVFSELSKWVTAPGTELSIELKSLIGRAPNADETTRARTLFARAIETPGGLKVQTIHSFCERLLQRFPLEAGVPPGFSILDDETAQALQREAIDGVLREATREDAGALGQALNTVIAYAAEDGFDAVLRAALAERDWLEGMERLGSRELDGSWEEIEALYRHNFGLADGDTTEAIDRFMADVLSDAALSRAAEVMATGKSTDQEIARGLAAALAAQSRAAKIAGLRGAFLTQKGEPRSDSRFVTKGIQAAEPGVHAILVRARDEVARLTTQRQALECAMATVALLRLTESVMRRYFEAKTRRAALDYDDLIRKSAALLNPQRFDLPTSDAEWVLYKLDGGLDHILVDESQDTSPAQWRVVEALAREFYAGSGARENARTLFAVGDEKQSIYSFQGAAPEKFAEMGALFEEMAARAGQTWRRIPLNLSFRTVAPILEGVDRVFADDRRTPGLTSGAEAIAHLARRFDQAGLIEIWDTEKTAATEAADAWSPLEEGAAPSAVERLAERIAATIKGWLDTSEKLTSQNRPIRPGDIIILVRKRRPFAGPMVAALKSRAIPVAGADRISLGEQIAVQDLLALGDFLTLPEDDLALASVLKSPLFGLNDDDLVRIAVGRKGSLWSALLTHARTEARYAEATEILKRWRGQADFSPPYEFFAGLLDRDGMRRRLLERLGLEATDAIDEFLNLALTYDDGAPPSLAGFLHWLRQGTREIKRDMEHGRDEVRVLTVHGAKGLEAPIVFLPDTCANGSGQRNSAGLLPLVDAAVPLGWAPLVWPVKGSGRLDIVARARSAAGDRERGERNRLLYVAMTRARDRLYVAGFEGKAARDPDYWYDLIHTALADTLERTKGADGKTIWRRVSEQTGENERPKSKPEADLAGAELPSWGIRPAPREPQLLIPLAPSRLAPYDIDEAGEPATPAPRESSEREPPSLSPATLAHDGRFLRGTLTHALLQHLPSLDRRSWPKAAAGFLDRRGAELTPQTRASIVAETLAILENPLFAPLFGPESHAEVPIVAEIPRPTGSGPPLKLTGQIDRLALIGEDVLIVDYKTNRPPPADAAGIAGTYLLQLAAYRLALNRIYPRRTVRAAILWTDGPRVVEVPAALLDTHTSRLWDIDPHALTHEEGIPTFPPRS